MSSSQSENSPSDSSASICTYRNRYSSRSKNLGQRVGLRDITNLLSWSHSVVDSKHLRRRQLQNALKRKILRREEPVVLTADHVIDIDRYCDDRSSLEVAKQLEVSERRYQVQCDWETVLAKNGIKAGMFEKLCDWMLEVCSMWNLERQTFLLSINLATRYLISCSVPVDPSTLQLLGVTCLLISYKFNESKEVMYLTILSNLTGKSFTPDEIRIMESAILNVLQFRLAAPTPLHFTDRLFIASSMHDDITQAIDDQVKITTYFLLEVAAVKSTTFQELPSLLAAASIVISRSCLGLEPWCQTFAHNVPYSKQEVVQCAGLLVLAAEGCSGHMLASNLAAHQTFIRANREGTLGWLWKQSD